MTGIQWTDETWNPLAGCSLASPGCSNCYAMRQAGGFLSRTDKYAGLTAPSKAGPVWTGEVRLWEPALDQPLRWREPRMIFVNSMSDLFHDALPHSAIRRVFGTMRDAPQHTYQILTKRADRMQQFVGWWVRQYVERPPANWWLGVSVEDRARLGRIEQLRATPAAIRFLSLEPLLEDLGALDLSGIDWVVVGGESGPGARPFDLKWGRSIIAQCQAADVPVFVKQLGSKPVLGQPGDDGWGRLIVKDRKGGNPAEWPPALRIREYPKEGMVDGDETKSGRVRLLR